MMRSSIGIWVVVAALQSVSWQSAATAPPSPHTWAGSTAALIETSVPPLTPVWSVNMRSAEPGGQEMFLGIAFIDNAVVALCSYNFAGEKRGWAHARLQALEAKTGKLSGTRELPTKGWGFSDGPIIYTSSPTSLVVELPDSLAEYDAELNPRTQIHLPAGRGIGAAKAYGYGNWTAATKSQCQSPIEMFRLNDEMQMIVACGHEVAFLDKNYKMAFAENYASNDNDPSKCVDSPRISADGKRVVLPLVTTFKADPPLSFTDYVLYDMRGPAPRKIVFSVGNRESGGNAAISPDGTKLAVLYRQTILVYSLPE
jgi:hypothetical protein